MVYVILSNYFSNRYTGVYSTLLNARSEAQKIMRNVIGATFIEDTGNYVYNFIAPDGKLYWLEIAIDYIDIDIEKE